MFKRVAEIMKENPISLEKSASLQKVVQIISQKGYSHVPVTEDGKLVGIVSKSDLITLFLKMLNQTSGKYYSQMLMEHISVGDIMHKDPIVVKRGHDVELAAELLLQGEFHAVTVINDVEEVVGMVTSFDLLKSLYSVDAR